MKIILIFHDIDIVYIYDIVQLQSPPGEAIFCFWVNILPIYIFGPIIGFNDVLSGSIDPTAGFMCTKLYNDWSHFSTGTWVTVTD